MTPDRDLADEVDSRPPGPCNPPPSAENFHLVNRFYWFGNPIIIHLSLRERLYDLGNRIMSPVSTIVLSAIVVAFVMTVGQLGEMPGVAWALYERTMSSPLTGATIIVAFVFGVFGVVKGIAEDLQTFIRKLEIRTVIFVAVALTVLQMAGIDVISVGARTVG